MGSGKTRLAERLAQTLGCPLAVVDQRVEEAMGMSIVRAVETKGELYFRKTERAVLEQLVAERGPLVVDLGGGTPCYYDNMEVIQEHFFTVYLSASPSYLARRLKDEKEDRPLLKGVLDEDLTEFIAKHLFERRNFYEQARLKVSAEKMNLEEKINAILQAWNP